MNILIIGTEKSIHDLKWVVFLAKHSPHTFFFISESPNVADEQYINQYKEAGVTLLKPLPPFSLIKVTRTFSGFRHLDQVVREHKIDLVHVIFPTPHLYWMTHLKMPVIVSTRGSDVLVVIKGLLESRGLKDKLLLRLMEKNLRKTDAITCTSELQESFLLQNFNYLQGKTSIARTGIDLDFIEKTEKAEKKTDKKIIFSPRFFSPIYNILNQVEALKQLPENVQQKLFVKFVRGKAYQTGYEQQILGALSKVKFEYEIVPYLTPKEMIQTYKGSDLVLMTPISDGTPNSALEAMASKRPLIISDLPYNSPLFEDTCFKANPHDVNDIRQKIEEALNEYPQTLIEAGAEAVKRYGNQAVEMNKIMALYERIGKAQALS